MSAYVSITIKGVENELEIDTATATTEQFYSFLKTKGIPDGYFTLGGKAFLGDHFMKNARYGFNFFKVDVKEGSPAVNTTVAITAPSTHSINYSAGPSMHHEPSDNQKHSPSLTAPLSTVTTKATLSDTRVVPYFDGGIGHFPDIDALAARAAAIVARGSVGLRRSAVGRAYSSDPTSVSASARASPTIGFAADFPRTGSRARLEPILSEYKSHLFRLKEEISRKPLEHGGLLRTLVVSTTAGGISLSVGKDNIINLSATVNDVRLARLCLVFSQSTAQMKENFDTVKLSYDGTQSSPELMAQMK